MNITEVTIRLTRNEKLKAYVTIIYDDCFVIRDLKIIQHESELFIAMPAKRLKQGGFRDIVHPLNHESRAQLEETIFTAYYRKLDQTQQNGKQ